jgi:translation elongation factor P/translation initiation factor 5A
MKKTMINGLTITETHEITTNETEIKVTSSITDAELDELNLEFHYDETVVIDTKDFEFITLTLENLKELVKKVKTSEKFFEDYWLNKLKTKYLIIDSEDKK